jgi:hypothetical protein
VKTLRAALWGLLAFLLIVLMWWGASVSNRGARVASLVGASVRKTSRSVERSLSFSRGVNADGSSRGEMSDPDAERPSERDEASNGDAAEGEVSDVGEARKVDATIAGWVEKEDGSRAAGARVHAGKFRAVANARGEFKLHVVEDSYVVIAALAEAQGAAAELIRVNAPGDSTTVTLVLAAPH